MLGSNIALTTQNPVSSHADDIEQKVYHSRSFCVLTGAYGGQKRGDAGADVLPHDDGDGGGIADLTGDSQGLQDTHGGGAGLDDAGQHGAGQHAKQRIFEQQKQL